METFNYGAREVREKKLEASGRRGALQRFHQKRSDQTISLLCPWSWQADSLSHLGVWHCQGGGWGVLRSLQPAAPPPLGTLGTLDTNSNNNTERFPFRGLNVPQISFQHGCHLCCYALRHCLALTCKQGRWGESGVQTCTMRHCGHSLLEKQHYRNVSFEHWVTVMHFHAPDNSVYLCGGPKSKIQQVTNKTDFNIYC